ncbi:hypothetical protein FF011L_16240 [Roseimaritima multifibrata]|uniref:Uncharacterized protein n=1 Tax=Roseimaritima multifibrata TaxID=1930274 RepID=A0A517MDA6_9BACT|nr:hypothetical protein [Roseimaritima multifibrata]QDS92870.1 hypothetical protein FF011L_16240 [Roseimaritima multifibrata]
MKLTNLPQTLMFALLATFLTIPFVGCGVESEPIGIESNDEEMLEDPEYIEGEEGI